MNKKLINEHIKNNTINEMPLIIVGDFNIDFNKKEPMTQVSNNNINYNSGNDNLMYS